MNRLRRHDYVVASFRVYDPFVGREADPAFSDEEGLVVHAVPMEDRTWCVARDRKGHRADSVIGVAAIFEDADCWLKYQSCISFLWGFVKERKACEAAKGVVKCVRRNL